MISYIIFAILAGLAVYAYFLIRRRRAAAGTAGRREPEKVKAEKYIVCPRCGERMILDDE